MRATRLLGHATRLARSQTASYRAMRSGHATRLHLGCGHRRLDGFVNVDRRPSPATDYVGDVAKLPVKPGTVDRIEAYHVIEHIQRPQVEPVICRWHSWLKRGGVLVLECPDFAGDVQDFLAGKDDALARIFGWQRYPGDAHHWGYTADSLCALLREVGFRQAVSKPPTDYHAGDEPCLRVEATS